MTDDRPRPRYGEYAPIPTTPVAPPAPVPAEAPAPVARRRVPRTWDLVLTTTLLLIGVFDVVAGFSRFADLGGVLNEAYVAQGFPAFTSMELAASAGVVINVLRVVLIVAAIVGSLALISRGRTAFWVPLAAGAAAALVVIVALFVVIISDPALAEYVAQQPGMQ
jgi:hypothetical protein